MKSKSTILFLGEIILTTSIEYNIDTNNYDYNNMIRNS